MGKVYDAHILTSTRGMTRADWLQWRRHGIGGSDAAAIVGLSPYSSPYTVYCDKVGLTADDKDTEAARLGRDLEGYVVQRWQERTGKRARRCNYMLQNQILSWMIADVDRLVIGEDAGLECKTTSAYNKTDFAGGDIPPYYYVQCQHYMAVTELPRWYLGVLVLGVGFYDLVVERNDDDIDALTEAEGRFWHDHVVPRVPPAPDGSDCTSKVLDMLYPRAECETVTLYGMEPEAQRYLALNRQIKALNGQKKEIQNRMKAQMRQGSIGIMRDYTARWDKRGFFLSESKGE